MTFTEMIKLLEEGGKCKRTDWGYYELAFITLNKHNGNFHFYITGEFTYFPQQQSGYGITYQDIISDKWEEM